MPNILTFLSKSMLIPGMLFYLIPLWAAAQPIRSHAIRTNTAAARPVPVTGTLDIIAVRVTFQPDENRFTSGNGTFGPGSLPYLTRNPVTIDPLPHDRSYFEAHLEFARNYFFRVSNGALDINYRLLPETVNLDNRMEFYAPTGTGFSTDKLARLVRDVWNKVEENGGFDTAGLDPERTAFIIFHAGVGRDIELTGTTLDKTPQDLPSIYLDQKALANGLERPAFDGFPINGGSLLVQNSMILPRTLSRRGEDVSGSEFVLQLSLNGLLCASIGSHLGLPDLFNTRTGDSGIGRFGLMDGASFFSYRGLFPPEPSAWEKSYLGWTQPFDIAPEDNLVSLTASGDAQTGDIARIPLSDTEYFLVENRHRDPESDGVTLTIQTPAGERVTQNFTNSDETFVTQSEGFAELFEPGVVTDVKGLDWSLPGGLDPGPDGVSGTADDRLLNGGILIWHIDQGIIERSVRQSGVNANPKRRGVDLEEADGAQDIGEPADPFTADRSGGSPFDFWWRGNNASVITSNQDTLTLYQNRFGDDTHPDNRSNTGARAFFELFDFSGNTPVATFRIRPTPPDYITPVDLAADIPASDRFRVLLNGSGAMAYPPSLAIFEAAGDHFLILPGMQSTYALSLDGGDSSLFDFRFPASQQPFTGQRLILGTYPSSTGSVRLEGWDWEGANWSQTWNRDIPTNRGFLSSPDGRILQPDFSAKRILIADGTALSDLQSPELRSRSVDGHTALIRSNMLTVEGSAISRTLDTGQQRVYVGALKLAEDRPGFFLLQDNSLSLIEPGSRPPIRELYQSDGLNWPAMADMNGDGYLEFIFVDRSSNTLQARNLNGGSIAGFPITLENGQFFAGTPLLADIRGDDNPELITVVQDSVSMKLMGYTTGGEPVEGFPLLVGGVDDSGALPVSPVFHEQTLYAVSQTGNLTAWRFSKAGSVPWPDRYGKHPNNKVSALPQTFATSRPATETLVDRETYNWPNPASEATHIRFQTSGPGEVQITVISIDGIIQYEKELKSRGGPPEEHRISTRTWGSGIYLARIEATVEGHSSQKLIKIAVVH